MRENRLLDGEYVEPYAGGASVAIALLFSECVTKVHINDFDPAIYAFWVTMLADPEGFCERVRHVALTVEEWKRQRGIYRDPSSTVSDLGFATFYLNRTNRSGIIKGGGLIGGLGQTGDWGIDARFSRDELTKRITRIGRYRDLISVTNEDSEQFLRRLVPQLPSRSLVYLDPPYYVKGRALYANYYGHEEHTAVARLVSGLPVPWIVSYDNVPEVRDLYSEHRRIEYGLRYTAAERTEGKEVMFFSPLLKLPSVEDPSEVTPRMILQRPLPFASM